MMWTRRGAADVPKAGLDRKQAVREARVFVVAFVLCVALSIVLIARF
ncbi:Uncharacterised protein [Serratia fonticola]|nr:Uncharacterised protein [Serratia fonticola]